MKQIPQNNLLKEKVKNSKFISISRVYLFPFSILRVPFSVLLIIILSLNNATAQKKMLTYEEAINIALVNNISIKQQQNNLKVSKAEKQQSVANFLPGINASGRGYRTDGRQWSNEESAMVNTTIDRATYSIGADLTVFNGFRNAYRLRQSNNLLDAQKERVEQSKQNIIYLVSQQFTQILLDKELVLIAEQDVEVQKKLFEQLEVYVKTGTRTRTELLSQEAQLKTSEVNLLSLQNQLQQDKASLAKTLHLETGNEFSVIQPNWDIDSILQASYNIDSLYQFALDSRPELKLRQAEVEANQNEVGISRSGYMPRIGIYYNYGSDYSSNYRRFSPADSQYYNIALRDQLLNENYSHLYGFYISVPIFNRLQTRTNVTRSKIGYENAILDYQDFKMQLFIDIQNAYQDFISQKATFMANQIRVKAFQQAYEKHQEMYRMGKGSLIDLSIENRRKIEAKSEEAQSKYNLVLLQVVLNYYIGQL